MKLNNLIPLLFATPRPKDSIRAIIFSIATLVSAVICYLAADLWNSFPYFLVMTLLIAVHGYVSLITTGANLLYIFRYFLVWILIFGTALVWYIYPEEVFVAPFGLNFQTAENTRVLVLAGAISLCGSLIGWHIALFRYRDGAQQKSLFPDKYRRRLIAGGTFISLLFAVLYIWKAGGFLGGGRVYAGGQSGFSLEFGVFNLFHFTGIALVILGSMRGNKIPIRYITLCVFTLVLGMLAGSRADFLPQAALILMLIFNPNVLAMLRTGSALTTIKYLIGLFLALIMAYFVATFIAVARTGIGFSSALDIIVENQDGLLINSVYGHKMLYFETGNMMLGGLYSAIVQVREGYTGLLYGSSYFNYLLISPPALLGLPRPLGLEWFTDINGVRMTQGGIFEVAEAYWNFGLIGCFFVSLLFSYFFGWLLVSGLTKNSYFYLTWYIVYGLHGFRSIWYQNFGYFRLMTVMLVIYLFSLFFFRWFLAHRAMRTVGDTVVSQPVS